MAIEGFCLMIILVISTSVVACKIKNAEIDNTETIETVEAVVETTLETEDILESPEPVGEGKEEESVTKEPIVENQIERFQEYSVIVGDGFIALRDWDNAIDITGLLGEPLSEEVIVLDQDSDTFSGSYLKTIRYDGLEIKLFSPKDNGNSFWIMEITISGGEYTTFQGIKIGDPLESLKDKYPSISNVEDGRTDDNNRAYEISDIENYNYLRFEVGNGLVSQIRLFHMSP